MQIVGIDAPNIIILFTLNDILLLHNTVDKKAQ